MVRKTMVTTLPPGPESSGQRSCAAAAAHTPTPSAVQDAQRAPIAATV